MLLSFLAILLGLALLVWSAGRFFEGSAATAEHSQVMRKELPILAAVTALAAWQLWDGELTLVDAIVLLGVFALLMAWSIRQGLTQKADTLGAEIAEEMSHRTMPLRSAVVWLIVGPDAVAVRSGLWLPPTWADQPD